MLIIHPICINYTSLSMFWSKQQGPGLRGFSFISFISGSLRLWLIAAYSFFIPPTPSFIFCYMLMTLSSLGTTPSVSHTSLLPWVLFLILRILVLYIIFRASRSLEFNLASLSLNPSMPLMFFTSSTWRTLSLLRLHVAQLLGYFLVMVSFSLIPLTIETWLRHFNTWPSLDLILHLVSINCANSWASLHPLIWRLQNGFLDIFVVLYIMASPSLLAFWVLTLTAISNVD